MGDNEKLCAMETRLRFESSLPLAGIQEERRSQGLRTFLDLCSSHSDLRIKKLSSKATDLKFVTNKRSDIYDVC